MVKFNQESTYSISQHIYILVLNNTGLVVTTKKSLWFILTQYIRAEESHRVFTRKNPHQDCSFQGKVDAKGHQSQALHAEQRIIHILITSTQELYNRALTNV